MFQERVHDLIFHLLSFLSPHLVSSRRGGQLRDMEIHQMFYSVPHVTRWQRFHEPEASLPVLRMIFHQVGNGGRTPGASALWGGGAVPVLMARVNFHRQVGKSHS